MKKLIRIIGYIILCILFFGGVAYSFFYFKWISESKKNLSLLGKETPILIVDQIQFRDLNKNGKLDVYEDHRAAIEDRINDLLAQMNNEEKAGLIFINRIALGENGEVSEVPSFSNPLSFLMEKASEQIARKQINHFNIMKVGSAEDLLKWHNNLQNMAERTRLGIPVTIATNPIHGGEVNFGSTVSTSFFSYWPSPLGFGAIGDIAIIREFGDIARQEYLAVGLRWALHPMGDLATEPRWARLSGTFGEDAYLSAKLMKAYILGFQGDSLSSNSVACMSKHFAGGGPQEDGWDAHFASGKGQVYPGNNFDYHLIPFTEGALAANTASIMTNYAIPKGIGREEVGFAFSKEMVTDLLRDSLKFDRIVCSDWGVITDTRFKPAAAWGIEDLSEKERVLKVFNAGGDMIGGESRTDLVLELIKEGKISQKRLNASVRRILRDKFTLGLFDNPYVDQKNLALFEKEDFKRKGEEAQRRSLVLLKNEDSILPLVRQTKVYLDGLKPEAFGSFAKVVENVEEADVIVQKFTAPYRPADNFMENFFHQGRLDFTEDQKQEKLELITKKPTITIMTIDRPGVIPEINKASKAMIADFECQDKILAELIFGAFTPSGKLPIEIPSSMEAVENQLEDVPYDSKDPLYPFGFGITYKHVVSN
ncbi:glycoside hydrolase family 3 N-terminal domain-containing protein [Limibacter armeniacum]|uniref:glycoside hydrolase family 3 protein n=1 Tax=Limibacter armeniacum TaxID=466084 RepID=UPI002FE58F61